MRAAHTSCSTARRAAGVTVQPRRWRQRSAGFIARGFKVEIEHEGEIIVLDVPGTKTILEVAIEKGIELPHDCKMGVCMTCPARLDSGTVNQKGAILSEDVEDMGFALLCMAIPTSDCKLRTIPEGELLDEQLCA